MSDFNSSETPNSSDCISRQAAINVADYTDYTGLAIEDVKKVTDEVVKGLRQLPSARPEHKTGKWIYNQERGTTKIWTCSECGWNDMGEFNYCSNCGADMREGQDGER